MKKALLAAVALAALCALMYASYRTGLTSAEDKVEKLVDLAHKKGLEQGLEAGKQAGHDEALASGEKWHCIHAETPMDGNEVMF